MSVIADLWIELSLCVVSLGISVGFAVTHWTRLLSWKDERGFEDRIKDVRGMNTYNSYMLAGILVFLAFAANPRQGTAPIPTAAVWAMLIALGCAGLSLFFFPLGQPSNAQQDRSTAKVLWLKTIIFSQWTLILTIGGIFRTVLARLPD